MKTLFQKSPRIFTVNGVEIKDFGKLMLESNEMISLKAENGGECDITKKEWGYYLGSSLNSRLVKEGYKTALVLNEYHKLFVMLVDKNKLDEFKTYLKTNQNNKLACWLDEWLEEEH